MDSERLFSQSCRICSAELENGVFIFGEEGKNLYLQAKIQKYLYIKISVEDKLPKMICESCCRKLDSIHKFAMMAVKIQDKFNKLVTETSINITTDRGESKGLLHTYLTKGIKEKEEVTKMEVKVDPMLILACALDEDLSYHPPSDSDNTLESENSNNCNSYPKTIHSELNFQNRVLLNWVYHTNEDVVTSTSQSPKRSSSTSSKEDVLENEDVEIAKIEQENSIRFKCPVCGKIISTKGNLKVHLETHRPKGKYGCNICGRIFKTQCNLYRHIEYHKGTQFPCDVCGRVYPTNSTLRAHSITHSDLRPHKCPLCVKTFKRNQDLKFHINQHTGARPYQCPYCPKAFASSGNCFSHRKRMHPYEVERDREKAAKIMR
ncbi:hypothetical protein FQA39_LY17750 [Lamprigera yunnana]|nr:hypothetical protein FQA39_LY17750 [Lamprigera yunnana]